MHTSTTESAFHDGYRSIFRFSLDRGETVGGVAQHYVRDWLAARRDGVARNALDLWDGRENVTLPGGTHIEFVSFDDQRSGDTAVRYRITDQADEGEYRVTLSAVADGSPKEPGVSIVVEVARSAGSDADATSKIAPPLVVGQILDQRRVFDGRTRLQGCPRVIHVTDIDELVEAIADPDRQVAVVLASSLSTEADEKWRVIVEELTQHTVGTAAVYAVAANAVEALNDALPEGLWTGPGRIRTIAPRVNFENPDVRRHPILSPDGVAAALDSEGIPNPGARIWFAEHPRRYLLNAPMPGPLRRGMALLGKEERRTLVSTRIDEQVEDAAQTRDLPSRAQQIFPRRSEHHARGKETGRFWTTFYALVARWLAKESVTEDSIEDDLRDLDRQITRDRQAIAVHEEFLSQAEADRDALNVQIAELKEEGESLSAQLEEALSQAASAHTEETDAEQDTGVSSLEAKVAQVDAEQVTREENGSGLRDRPAHSIDARNEVRRALDLMVVRVDPIIETVVGPHIGDHEWTDVLADLDYARGRQPGRYYRKDPSAQLRMLTERLGPIGFPFEVDANRAVSTPAQELRTLRNYEAHNYDLEDLDGFRVHDFLVRLLKALGDEEGEAAALAMRTEVEHALWSGALAPEVEEDEPTVDADTGSVPAAVLANPSPNDAPQQALPDETEREVSLLGQAHLPYEAWVTLGGEDPEHLEHMWQTASKDRVRGVVEQIVENEGPIALSRLVSLAGREFGFQRLHSDRERKLVSQVRASKLTIDKDNFVWPDGINPETWTQFRPSDTGTDREFTDISPVEIRNAARSVREANPNLDPDTFELSVLNTFGRKRRTKAVRLHLQKALSGD